MNPPLPAPMTAALLGLALLGTTGCVSHHQPPSTEIRSQFAPMQVEARANSAIGVERAATKSTLGRDWVHALEGPHDGTSLMLAVALTPVVAIAGSTYGKIAGEDPAVATATAESLRRRAAGFRLETHLRDRVIARLNQPGLPGGFAATKPARTSTSHPTLRLTIYEPGLKTDGGELRFVTHVSVQVVDPQLGEIYYDYLEYHGPAQKSTAWTASDGAPLFAAVDTCVSLLATEIVEQVFLRSTLDADTVRRLAASGITRREEVRSAPQLAQSPVARTSRARTR